MKNNPSSRRMKGIAAAIIFGLLCFGLICASHASAASSEDIRGAIFKQIEAAGTFRGYELDIQSRAGTVWLRGHVASDSDKAAVQDIAAHTRGVLEVRNELTIVPVQDPNGLPLARAVQARIHPITATSAHAVTIAANDGTVTLEGVVSSESTKHKIEDAAKGTAGVTAVVNNVKVLRPDDKAVGANIERLIAETPEIQITDFKVSVQNGIATLSGMGKTHRDTDHALSLALMVDGVEDVKSEFTLEQPAPPQHSSRAAKQKAPAAKHQQAQ